MKIIQNFSSNKHYHKIPVIDILIWICGLLSLKSLGHKLKLYCKTTDIEFLKEFCLYNLYDEIDTDFLDNYKTVVDETNFWSFRKLACIENEFKINSEEFIYSDTDVVMATPLICPYDILVWGLEPADGVYIPLETLSTPENYTYPEWFLNTLGAYNCGVLAFKNKAIFDKYLAEYLSFTINNPCILKLDDNYTQLLSPQEIRSIWACNAEQKLLKGLAEYLNLKVAAITSNPHEWLSTSGVHYYILRYNWREYEANKTKLTDTQIELLFKQLTVTAKTCLETFSPELRSVFLNKYNILKEVYENGATLTTYI